MIFPRITGVDISYAKLEKIQANVLNPGILGKIKKQTKTATYR